MLRGLLKHDVKEIGVKQANQENDAIFIDAREKKEYDISHIKNSIWVGYDNYSIKPLALLDKTSKIIVYCSVGYRSEIIAKKLIALGFQNSMNLYGGIFEWVNQGYPVYDLQNQVTSKVHAYSKSWGIWLNEGEKVYD